MPTRTENPLEVPDSLRGFRVDLVEEAAPIFLREHASESPGVVVEGLDVLDLDEEDIAGLGGFDFKRAREVMDLGQVDVLDVVGGVVVFDLAAGPVEAFDFDDFVVGDGAAEGDVGVPAVLPVVLLVLVRHVDEKHTCRYGCSLGSLSRSTFKAVRIAVLPMVIAYPRSSNVKNEY
jgi:hypothetical protein